MPTASPGERRGPTTATDVGAFRPMAERWRCGSALNGPWRPRLRSGSHWQASPRAGRGKVSRLHTSGSAVYRQDIRPGDGVLSAISLVPFKNRLAFAVQDAQRHRFGWEGEICGADNCSGHVRRLNFNLAQDRQPTTWGSAKKLNPERLRLRSEDAFQFI